MRRDELYFVDMLEAATAACGFVSTTDKETFKESDLLHSAVLRGRTRQFSWR
ncbi:MAG: hypothetical protein ACQSGP_28545 [Frankia sp.]